VLGDLCSAALPDSLHWIAADSNRRDEFDQTPVDSLPSEQFTVFDLAKRPT